MSHLSEFTYGFAFLQEVLAGLRSVGQRAVPYLPNLRREGKVGYDVLLNRRGRPLILQFKLSDKRQRLWGVTPPRPSPLRRPFHRVRIDTNSSQFKLLEAWEADSEVYYAAPRFFSWVEFEKAFTSANIYEMSVIAKPSVLSSASPRGRHQLVFDLDNQYVCSKGRSIEQLDLERLSREASDHAQQSKLTLADVFERQLDRLLADASQRQRNNITSRVKQVQSRSTRQEAVALAATSQLVSSGAIPILLFKR